MKLVSIGLWTFTAAVGLLWIVSLPIASYMFFAFDSEVSISEGLVLGIIQATWVVGIPVLLLALSHLAGNGWRAPKWEGRWLLIGLAFVLWCGIIGFWLFASAGDNTA